MKCGTNNNPCRNRVCRHIKLNTLTSFVIKWQKTHEIICVFPFFRIWVSSRHLPMRAVEFARGWKDRAFDFGQALLTFQLRNNNKLNKTTMWGYFPLRLSVVFFFLTCISIMMCSRINICLANATNVCDIWHHFISLSVLRLRWVGRNNIDYDYVNNFPIFY